MMEAEKERGWSEAHTAQALCSTVLAPLSTPAVSHRPNLAPSRRGLGDVWPPSLNIMTRPPVIFYFTCEAKEKEDLSGDWGRGGKTAWERRGKLEGGRGRSAGEENDVSHHLRMQRRKEEDGAKEEE